MGTGVLQIETGIALTREDGQDSTSFPTLLRIGLADHWELRVESDILTLQNLGSNGFADSALATKVTLHDGEFTQLGLLAGVSIPVGPQALRATFDPGLAFLWDQDLGGDWLGRA